MTGTFDWMLEPRNGGSEATAWIDYQMPGGSPGRAVDTLLVERMNEKNAEHMLENPKLVAEAIWCRPGEGFSTVYSRRGASGLF